MSQKQITGIVNFSCMTIGSIIIGFSFQWYIGVAVFLIAFGILQPPTE